MILNDKEIIQSIEWLKENAEPPVKYLTYKNLLGKFSDTKLLSGLWKEVENYKDVRKIFFPPDCSFK